MATIELIFEDPAVELQCRELHGSERLGEATELALDVFSKVPVAAAAVLGKACTLAIRSELGERAIRGLVTRFVAVATAQRNPERLYRLTVRSTIALLGLRRRSRVFQHMTIPDVVRRVLTDLGWDPRALRFQLSQVHAQREYLVQYDETDEAFMRRICEEDGLYFRFVEHEGDEVFVLEDSSTSSGSTLSGPILVSDPSGLEVAGLAARNVAMFRRRRAGKVTLRDYDPLRPALALEGTHADGTPLEQGTEVYAAPGRFADPNKGAAQARLHLESLRVDAAVVAFDTNATELAPGDAFELECGPAYDRSPRPEGPHFAIAVTHSWVYGKEHATRVEAVPSAVPFRLARRTPRPRIHGIHRALVTGAPGEEIHPDSHGRIFVRFDWDLEGPLDDKSSLPVRVAQPNTPGSLLIPRVGWEVFVVFEDGDPDRPYVIGRAYNAKQPPPVALPANKTMTHLQSLSSPGGGKRNAISFDDAAGRQHMVVNAAFAKSTNVGNNMFTQTAKVEKQAVTGNQSRIVGANEDVSVAQAYLVEVASQSASVGGTQSIYVQGKLTVDVGSESVTIGAALIEKVGDPVKGATNLAVSAALAVAGSLGEKLGPLGQALAGVGTGAAGVGWGMLQAAMAPGAGDHAARDAGIRGVLGAGAGMVPGGDAILASATSMGMKFPWETPPAPPGDAEAGGGAGGGASDSAGAAGPGPGHRNEKVKGAMSESIGGSHSVMTPGQIRWQTAGAALVTIGGSHSTKATAYTAKVLGASSETLGSFHIETASHASREAKGAITTTIGGSLTSSAGGEHSISAGTEITIKVGGSLTLVGGKVSFVVGGSSLSSSAGGVLIKASTIKITGASTQSGTASHT